MHLSFFFLFCSSPWVWKTVLKRCSIWCVCFITPLCRALLTTTVRNGSATARPVRLRSHPPGTIANRRPKPHQRGREAQRQEHEYKKKQTDNDNTTRAIKGSLSCPFFLLFFFFLVGWLVGEPEWHDYSISSATDLIWFETDCTVWYMYICGALQPVLQPQRAFGCAATVLGYGCETTAPFAVRLPGLDCSLLRSLNLRACARPSECLIAISLLVFVRLNELS